MRRLLTINSIIFISIGLIYLEGVILLSAVMLILISIALSFLLFILFRKKKEVQNRILLIIFSTCFAISLIDLTLRPVLADNLWYRPDDRFLHRHYEYPELHRFKKNVEWKGTVYGDLAAISGEEDLREYREIEFITDQYGFRNYPVSENDSFDIIALGDSYTYGSGTSHDDIWTSQLEKISGSKVYNLATPGGPWAELMNLQLELPRIKLKKNAKIIWMIFSGNDLDDYYGSTDFKNLKRNKGWKKYWAMLQGWRFRSPIRLYTNKLLKDKAANSTGIVEGEYRRYMYYEPYMETAKLDEQTISTSNEGKALKKCMELFYKFCNQKQLTGYTVVCNAREDVMTKRFSGFSDFIITTTKESSVNGMNCFVIYNPFDFQDFQTFRYDREMCWWTDDTHLNPEGSYGVAYNIYHQIFRPIFGFEARKNRMLNSAETSR